VRIRLKDLAERKGGVWLIPGTGKVKILDYGTVVRLELFERGLVWMMPLHDLRRHGRPLGGLSDESTL
jgi:hypothetical protein